MYSWIKLLAVVAFVTRNVAANKPKLGDVEGSNEAYRDLFKALDKNQDGFVAREEMKTVLMTILLLLIL
jgi:Ca2+-binding EF-hand superfamily protein